MLFQLWLLKCSSHSFILSIAQVVQLLETPFVNLVNYSSLVTTNAARHRFVAGKSKTLLEFGLRRAQVIVVAFSRFFPIMELSFCIFCLSTWLLGTWWRNKCFKILLYGRIWRNKVYFLIFDTVWHMVK